jgi:hypothetical protein
MPTIRGSHCDLVEAPLAASLSTVGADGTPQTAAISIWFVFEGEPADRRVWPRARRVFSSGAVSRPPRRGAGGDDRIALDRTPNRLEH